MTKTVFSGELQLLAWGESNTAGAWLKFQIGAEDLEKFRDLKTRSGKVAGHCLMAVMVEPEAEGAAPERPKLGPLCALAVQWCKSPEFWEWCNANSEEAAKAAILGHCGITSRKELDTNQEAGARFEKAFRKTFAKHLKDNGLNV